MKTGYVLAALVATTMVTGCSSEKHIEFTCVIATTKVSTCTEYTVPASKEQDANNDCTFQSGMVTFDPCTTDANLGKCSDISTGGMQEETWYFASTTVSTTVGAMTACSNAGGKFSTDDSTTTTTTTTTSSAQTCSSPSYCASFPDLTLSGSTTDAQTICTEFALGALTSTPCSMTDVVGVCKSTTPLANDMYFYGTSTDAATDEETCSQYLGGTFTTTP